MSKTKKQHAALKAAGEERELIRLLRRPLRLPNRASIKRNVRDADKLFKLLSKVSPHSSEHLISSVAVDLADLVRVGENHRLLVRKLLRMSIPKERERFRHLLISGTEGNLFFENAYHLADLRRSLPKLLRDMSKPQRKKAGSPGKTVRD
jgi:hypothetical protein